MGTIRSAVGLSAKRIAPAAILLLLSQPAAAGFVKVIGVRTRNNVSNSSITISVPSSGVAAGNSIIVTLQAGGAAGAISCSDPINGAYNTDVGSAADVVRIAIASKPAVSALGFGVLITCTYPFFSGASSASAYEFSGLEPVNTLDQTAQDGSSAAGAASSGLTAATAQANELVFGFFWVPNPAPTQTFTPATSGGSPVESPYTPPYAQLSAGGTQKPMYRFVSSIRQYEANGTVSGSGGWKAQVATYRLAPDLCTGVNCDDGNACTADTCDPATGLCAHTPVSAGAVCGDLSSGICDGPDLCDGAGVCLTNQVADGTVCGAVNDDCENLDTCQSGVCQDNGVKAAGTLCGSGAAGPCNAADTCNASGVCQPNLAADGVSCGDAGSACVVQDTCQSGACRDNGYRAAGTACGDSSSGACDNADTCDGSGTCGANPVAGGTPCDDGEACTTGDSCDGSGLCAGVEDALCFACIGNTAPVVAPAVFAEPIDPKPVGDGSAVVTASFEDTLGQTHTCTIDWGDGSLPDPLGTTEPTATDPGACTGTHLYTAVGVYEVAIAIADMCGASGGAVHGFFVLYDPSAGFATGAGWIQSPPGAYPENPGLDGRAYFGFVSRYDRGATVPNGQTRFHFDAGDFQFDSTSYEWLVLSGARARFRGIGTVNGMTGYGFEATASDGQAPGGGGEDRFRIKIWQGNPGSVVYDNLIGQSDGADPTPLGGGSITIQKK